MKKIHHIQGILNSEFQGQIGYSIALPETYQKLIIQFSFDKQSPMGESPIGDEKTEIHITAEQNGTFIGGIHKQRTKRILVFSPWYASKGCLPCEKINGMLKINILIFRVLYNQTRYTLDIWSQV